MFKVSVVTYRWRVFANFFVMLKIVIFAWYANFCMHNVEIILNMSALSEVRGVVYGPIHQAVVPSRVTVNEVEHVGDNSKPTEGILYNHSSACWAWSRCLRYDSWYFFEAMVKAFGIFLPDYCCLDEIW